jgi:hypothetical protein
MKTRSKTVRVLFIIAFESVPLGGVGLSGDGPRGAGSPGRSRAGRAPAGGQPGGTSGARRAVEKPWRGGGAGELLGGTGGWAAGGQRRRGRVGLREKWLYFSYTLLQGECGQCRMTGCAPFVWRDHQLQVRDAFRRYGPYLALKRGARWTEGILLAQ